MTKMDMNIKQMDADLVRQFKIVCIDKGKTMKEVIVDLMKMHIMSSDTKFKRSKG